MRHRRLHRVRVRLPAVVHGDRDALPVATVMRLDASDRPHVLLALLFARPSPGGSAVAERPVELYGGDKRGGGGGHRLDVRGGGVVIARSLRRVHREVELPGERRALPPDQDGVVERPQRRVVTHRQEVERGGRAGSCVADDAATARHLEADARQADVVREAVEGATGPAAATAHVALEARPRRREAEDRLQHVAVGVTWRRRREPTDGGTRNTYELSDET